MTKLTENIQFLKISGVFLLKLDEDIKNLKSSKKTFISADKIQNLFEIKTEDHEETLYVKKKLQKRYPLLPKKISIEERKRLSKMFF